MTVFIELVTDPFDATFASQVSARQNPASGRASRAGKTVVRRPTRGIEIKDDTYAYMKVVMSNGVEWPLLDSSAPDGVNTGGYSNFILQSVTEQRMEKHQIVETFGDTYIFFFGESPRFLDCTATLINTLDFNWRAEWWHNYENYLRGTKLVELGARCYMFWDDNIVEGYMLNSVAQENAQDPYKINLSFKFFVTKYQNVSLVNVEQYPVRSSVMLPDGIELTDADSFDRLQAFYAGNAEGSRASDAAARENPVIQNLADDGSSGSGPAQARKITQKIRQLPASAVVDPAVWNKLVGVVGIASPSDEFLTTYSGGRVGGLRSLIANNVDEYLGPSQGGANNMFLQNENQAAQSPGLPGSLAAKDAEEVDNLGCDTVQTLEAIGVEADNPNTLNELGLGPNFSAGYRSNVAASLGVSAGLNVSASIGASASFGASASASVTFGATANASAGASAGVSASARAGYYANASAETGTFLNVDSSYALSDPLASVYGRATVEVSAFSSDRREFVEGAGDYQYGYRSAYGKVGYGKSGYGDMGGKGFGSCNDEGDPGFLDPEQFSYKGVSSNGSAFNAWVRPRQDKTALTKGAVFGGVSVTGSASLSVGGASSAFSVVALEGELEDWVVLEAEAGISGDISGSLGAQAQADANVVVGPGQAGQ